VNAEACARVLMHDAMMLRSQAVHAEQSRDRADHEWRAAVGSLEVRLADRGFEGFGHERNKMAAEISKLQSELEVHDRDNWRLRGEVEELQSQLSSSAQDCEREKHNARRLAAIAAEREGYREERDFLVHGRGDPVTDTDDLRSENERLRSFIRNMATVEQVSPSPDRRLQAPVHASHNMQLANRADIQLEQELASAKTDFSTKIEDEILFCQFSTKIEHEKSASQVKLQGRAAVEHIQSKNNTTINKLEHEVAVLKEALRKQSRSFVEIQNKNDGNCVKVNALQHALAEALRQKEDQECTLQDLHAQIVDARLEPRQFFAVMAQVESIASILEGSGRRVSNLIGNCREHEQKAMLSAQAASDAICNSTQRQQRIQELTQLNDVLEADVRAKGARISLLQGELSNAFRKASEQTSEIHEFRVKIQDLGEQLKKSTEKTVRADRQALVQENSLLEARIEALFDTADMLDYCVGTGLHSACLKVQSRAVDAEVQGRWQHEKLAALHRQEIVVAELEAQVSKLGSDNLELDSRLRLAEEHALEQAQVETECTELKAELESLGIQFADLHSTLDSWKSRHLGLVERCGTQHDEYVGAMARLSGIINEHEVALDLLSKAIEHMYLAAAAHTQQRTAEMIEIGQQLSEFHGLRRVSSEAQTVSSAAEAALTAAAEEAAQAAHRTISHEQTIVQLEHQLQKAMLVVEEAAEFKRNLEERVHRINGAWEADRDTLARSQHHITSLQARIGDLETAANYSCAVESIATEEVGRLLTAVEEAECTLNSAMTYSVSVKSGLAALSDSRAWVSKHKVAELAEQAVRKAAHAATHVRALQQLQVQHERLLAELEGRETLIAMMEEQQVGLHAQMLHLENENRELSFSVQGHSIVHNIEHQHLEHALTKAHAATHVVVEAHAQELRFQQHYTKCADSAVNTHARLTQMELALSRMAEALEQTLVRCADLLKYRNVVSLARTPLFVPRTRSGAHLSIVMAKNVCFLVENAGVPLLRRGAAVAEELVYFFSEQFDSWMHEIVALSDQKQECEQERGKAVDCLQKQLLHAHQCVVGMDLCVGG